MTEANRQLDMFGQQDKDLSKKLDNRRRSRPTDPVSSQEGAAHIEGKIGALKMTVLQHASYVPQTAREIAELCAEHHGGEVESYRKRLKEMADAGWLRAGAYKNCSHTGRLARTYLREY